MEQRTRGEKVMARLSASPGGIGGYGGGGWTNNRYEQVRHFNGWVYIAVDAICKKIACQRPGVYRVHQFAEPQKRMKCLAGPYRRKAMADLQPHEDLEPLPPEYPLCQLFQNPNPPDTSYDLWYETILYLLLTGNSYWWLPKNGLGKPVEIWCLPAHWVWPIFDETSDLVAYELRPLFGSVGTCRLSADEVVHFKFKNPMSKVDGYSPLAAIANWIDVAESIDKARYHTFDNSGNPGMIALLDDETVDPTDDEIRQFETKLEHKFRGVTKTGRITALSGVKELKPYSTTPAEMAYVESDDQARDKVLAGFRVSKVLCGIATEVNRACLDQETECLTAAGWVSQDQISESTRIACYDPEADRIVYRAPSAIIRFHHEGEAVKMANGTSRRAEPLATAVMTLDHRMYLSRPGNKKSTGSNFGKWRIARARDVLGFKSKISVLCAARAACDAPESIALKSCKSDNGGTVHDLGFNYVDPDIWMEFLGWFVSEGCLRTPSGNCLVTSISQKTDSPHVANIERILAAMPIDWHRKTDKRGCYEWWTTDKGLYQHLLAHAGKGAENKSVPAYVKSWPAESLEKLLNAALAGDGSQWRRTTKFRRDSGSCTYHSVSRQLADDIQELAVKCGLRASLAMARKASGKNKLVWRVNISKRRTWDFQRAAVAVEPFSGLMWCVQVPTGLFVVRRRGFVHITGNSHDGAVLSFCENTINPLLFQLGCTITEKVATRFDPRLRVSWMDCTPDDPTQKLAEQTADVAAGATTPNEIRRDRGKEPYAYGGDDPLVSTSLAPMPMNSPPEADTFDWASIVKPGQGDGKKDGAGDEEDSEDDEKPSESGVSGNREEADGGEDEDDEIGKDGIRRPAFSTNGHHGGRF